MHPLRMILLAGALTCASAIGFAQTPPQNSPQTPQAQFRVLDQERLFRESALGQQILAQIRAAEATLEAENQALFDQLAAEERALTAARATLAPEDFRAQADAFEVRVEAIRAERAERSRTLAQQNEAAAQRFFNAALPVLVQLMNEAGIQALFKPEVMILGPDWLDITQDAITALDAALAEGALTAPQPADN